MDTDIINNLEESLINTLIDYFSMDTISQETDILDLCIYDFMEFVEVIMIIEEKYKIDLKNYDTDDIRYVNQILKFIQEKNRD